jgi:hypothetical protein
MNALAILALGGLALVALKGRRRASLQLSPAPEEPRQEESEEAEKSEGPEREPGPRKNEIRENLEAHRLPAGYELPDDFEADDVWVSEDCQAYAIGGRFFQDRAEDVRGAYAEIVAALQAEEDSALGELATMSHPTEWDRRSLVEMSSRPAEDNPSIVWVRGVLPSACASFIPAAEDSSSWEDHAARWEAFGEDYSALSEVITHLAEWADGEMASVWLETLAAQPYITLAEMPVTSGEIFEIREAAIEVNEQSPSLTLDDRADEVYARLYSSVDACPKVIDPQNPDHNYCKELWHLIRDIVDTYGD